MKTKNQREYQVVQGNTPEEMAVRVTAALTNDWVLYLGLQVTVKEKQLVFAQAMTRVFSAPTIDKK